MRVRNAELIQTSGEIQLPTKPAHQRAHFAQQGDRLPAGRKILPYWLMPEHHHQPLLAWAMTSAERALTIVPATNPANSPKLMTIRSL